jgi:hypothetical protein
VWCTPVANPRCSFGHHSAIIATLTGSIPPVPMPITTRHARSAPRVLVSAVAVAETQVTATAATRVQARR